MKWIIQSFVLGFLLISSAAQAESQLDLTITRLTPITASSPLSGTDIVYEVLFQCSAVDDVECKNSVIKIGPLPYEIDTAEVAPHPLIANSSFTRGTQGAAADGFITINLKQTVWAGSSIAFGVTLTTINGRTPNGFTWDVTATATASNANDSTDAADGKAYANSEIKVKKSVLPKRPVVDRTARYSIHSCADGTSHVGWLVLEDSLLVDTLPADVEYIGSSNGGVYDAAANTVTWSGFTLEPCEDTWIDVVFPSAIFGKTAPKITLATNNVTLSALPFAETERVTDDALVNHRFLDAIPSTTTGEIQKNVNKEWTYPWRAEESQIVWSIPFVNKGTLPTALELNDRLPCAYAANGRGVHTSPLMDETLCTDPSFITESITLGDTYTAAVAAGYSPVWTSNSGSTGTFTGSADSMTPAGLPQGDVIAEIKLPADPAILFSAAEWPITTKVHSVVQIKGRMNEKDTSSGAESTWVALTKIINREDHRLYGTGTTPITDWNSSTANVTVGKTGPLGSIYKDMARGGQNGSSTTDIVKIQAKSLGDEPIKGAIITDLLPAGITFKAFEHVKEIDGEVINSNLYSFEVLNNYNNTGRQLVRVTFNSDVDLSSKEIMFRANGVAPPERIPGTTWNEVQLHVPNGADLMCSGSGSGDLEDGFFPGGANILPMFETSTNDLHDADGDGLTDDKFCNYWYGIPKDTPAAYLVAEKFVKGDLDSEFAGFPTVGAMSSPGTGTFELRFKNKGTVGLESVVVYDIFPKIGDTGVKLDSIERKTEFTPTLASIPVVTGATSNLGALIQYTTSANPCRNKLKPIGHVGNWPDGCTYDWSDTPPNPLSDATGIRVSRLGDLPADSADVSSLDDRVISYTVNGPAGVKPGKVAWNSFAVSAVRSDGGEFLPIEPPKVGISPPLTDVEIAKTVNGKDSDSVYVGEIVDYKITVKHGTTVTVNDDGSVNYSNPSGYHFVFKPATEEMFDPATGETIPADPGSGPEPAPEDRGPLTAPATARDVVVKDVIPAGLELVPNSSDTTCGDMPKGSFDEATSIWTVGDIIPGQSFSLCYKAKVLTQGVHTNLVEVSIAGNVDDIDSTPGNIGETPEEDDEADAVVTGIPAPAPGINLKKQVFVDGVWHEADAGTDDLPVITQGQPIKYRFIVTNTGETYLNNVTITDPLIGAECTGLVNSYIATEEDSHPPGINISGIHANPWTVECTWPYGWDEGVTVNTASVTAESDFSDDPLTDENTAQVQVIIPGDHLSVVKSAPTNADNDGDGKISENDILTYTITATNFGTTELSDVVVTDELIEPSSITCATVAPTATCVLTGTHKVTNAEATSGQIINTASADDEGDHPSVTDSITSAIEPPNDDPNDPPGDDPEPVPTLSEYALIILSIMLMMVSMRFSRRRRFDRF